MASTIGTDGDYSTITAWEAALGGGGADDAGECFDEAFDEAFTINAGTNPSLGPNAGAEHNTVEGSGARIVWSQDRSTITLDVGSAALNHLEFDGGGFHGGSAFIELDLSGAGKFARRLLVHDVVKDTSGTMRLFHVSDGTVMNCFAYQNGHTSSGSGAHLDVLALDQFTGIDSQALNCTLHGNYNDNGGGNSTGVNGASDENVICKNVLCTDQGGTTSGTKQCFDSFGSPADVATNLSDDSTAPSAGSNEPVTASAEYTSTADPPNLLLKSGAGAIDDGTDLGTSPTGVELDIVERDRDAQGDTWDVGANEFVAAGDLPRPALNLNQAVETAGYH